MERSGSLVDGDARPLVVQQLHEHVHLGPGRAGFQSSGADVRRKLCLLLQRVRVGKVTCPTNDRATMRQVLVEVGVHEPFIARTIRSHEPE